MPSLIFTTDGPRLPVSLDQSTKNEGQFLTRLMTLTESSQLRKLTIGLAILSAVLSYPLYGLFRDVVQAIPPLEKPLAGQVLSEAVR